jgi:hypothetical protein
LRPGRAKLFRAREERNYFAPWKSEAISSPGGATDISRWRSAAQPPEQTKGIFRVPAGTLDKNSLQKQSESGALSDSAGEFRIGEFLQHCSHKEVGQFFNLKLRIKAQWNQTVIMSSSINTRQTRMNIGFSRVTVFP